MWSYVVGSSECKLTNSKEGPKEQLSFAEASAELGSLVGFRGLLWACGCFCELLRGLIALNSLFSSWLSLFKRNTYKFWTVWHNIFSTRFYIRNLHICIASRLKKCDNLNFGTTVVQFGSQTMRNLSHNFIMKLLWYLIWQHVLQFHMNTTRQRIHQKLV